ncbi:XTP/dITP diphosphatase [Lachnobacterium bovis]|uniref:XTP/dITP diphosphatase n=1 Tax=Lachnobacterium bovis TaxID=140626 RepID=UPI0003B61B5C|nr:XTP/dITP diphosphatase [Lachnobacterium bovis]
MEKIIFATGNENKVKEVKKILEGLDVEVYSKKELNIKEDVEETGSTFEENAILKAKAIAKYTDSIVIADDSGLEVDYLNKEPGIYSSRYLGEDTPYEVKNKEILRRLEGVSKEYRTARFVCAMAIIMPDGECLTAVETMEGYIGTEASGKNGFGYDPIFYPNGYEISSADMTMEEKNDISHRGKALRKIRDIIKEKLGD